MSCKEMVGVGVVAGSNLSTPVSGHLIDLNCG